MWEQASVSEPKDESLDEITSSPVKCLISAKAALKSKRKPCIPTRLPSYEEKTGGVDSEKNQGGEAGNNKDKAEDDQKVICYKAFIDMIIIISTGI